MTNRSVDPKVREILERAVDRYEPVKAWDLGADVHQYISHRGELSVAELSILMPLASQTEAYDELVAVVPPTLERATMKDLEWLHGRRKSLPPYTWQPGFRPPSKTVAKHRMVQIDQADPSAVWVLGLASFDPSGFVREAAVDRLTGRSERCSTAFILIRANDWVDEVSSSALNELSRRVETRLLDFAWYLPIVESLKLAARRAARMFSDRVHEALTCDAGFQALEDVLKASPDRFARRVAVARMAQEPPAAHASFLRAAIEDRDACVRLAAARWALAGLPAEDAIWEVLWDDKDPAIRNVAVEHWASASVNGDACLRRALPDRSPRVRDLTRFHLRQRGAEGVVEEYRNLCLSASPLAGAIAGLGEVGDASDTATLSGFLGDERSRIRSAAIRGLSRVLSDDEVRVFLHSLADPSPLVARAAADALEGRSFDGESLLSEGAAGPPHLAREKVRLLASVGGWRAASLLLEAKSRPEFEPAQERIRLLLKRWVVRAKNRFVQPAAEEVEKLRQALEKAETHSDGESWPEIRRELDTWAPRAD